MEQIILKIINYLFNKNNIVNTDSTINSFFDNGVAFPKYVSLIFNEEIPQLITKPKTIFHCKLNNDLALHFLFKKNHDIQAFSPNYYTKEDRVNLLSLILTKQCFKMSQQQILEKFNLIVSSMNLQFKEPKELVSKKCILALLSSLTDGKIQIKDENMEFNQLMEDIFQQADVPLFINEDSLNEERSFIFFIQIQIIFEIFSEKIKQFVPTLPEKKEKSNENSASSDLSDFFESMHQIMLEINEISNSIKEINSLIHDDYELIEEYQNQANKKLKKKQKKLSKKHKLEMKNESKRQKELKKLRKSEEKIKSKKTKMNKTESNELENDDIELDQKNEDNLNKMIDESDKANETEGIQHEETNEIDENQINSERAQKILKIKQMENEAYLELKLNVYNLTNRERIKEINKRINQFETSIRTKGYLSKSDKVKLYNISLLKTVNHIMKNEEIYFDNVKELFLFDFFPIFVKFFFQNDSESVNQLNQIIYNKNRDTVSKTIQFLITKDFTFDKTQFKEFDKYDDESIGSFLTLFLNKFFLKKSKQELLERCCSIVLGNTNKDDFFYKMSNDENSKEKNIIYIFELYIALLNFYQSRTSHMKCNLDFYSDIYKFNNEDIPSVIDSYFLSLGPTMPNDPIYYQLQFIFDSIDKKNFIYHFHEILLNALYKLKKVKVPKFKTIASRIKFVTSNHFFHKSEDDDMMYSKKADSDFHPILKTVKYLFMKNGIINNDSSINSFFDNGVSFPQFIEMIFKGSKIPRIINDPKLNSYCRHNNDLTLEFLFKKNQEISNIHPTIKTDEDKVNLLSLIIQKECFKIDPIDILNKCNLIIYPLKKYESIDELFNEKCILALLLFLTNGNININTNDIEFNQLMMNLFEQAKVPLIINETSLYPENHFVFFIQLEIIVETFSNEIQRIEKGSTKNESISDLFNSQMQKLEFFKEKKKEEAIMKEKEKEKIEEEKSAKERLEMEKFNYQLWKENNISKQLKSAKEQLKIEKSILKDEKKIKLKSYLTDFDRAELNNFSLLKTINAIAKNDDHYFKRIHELIECFYLPNFVSLFFQNDSESYSYIHQLIHERTNSDEKIKKLLEFLGKKEQIFNILLLNFTNKKLIESSTISFLTIFLNKYFLKKSKQELLQRCCSIILSNTENGDFFYEMSQEENINDENENKIIYTWETYLALLTFLNERTTHFNLKKRNNVDDSIYFKKKNVPQIIDSYFLSLESTIPNDSIYYQLQFIFDEIDRQKFIYRFHETLLNAMSKFKQVKIPNFNSFAKSIRVRNVALIEQQKRYQQFLLQNSESEIYKTEELIIKEDQKLKPKQPKTYLERRFDVFSPFNNDIDEYDSSYFPEDNINFFKNYSFEDNILFETEMKNNKNQIKWINYKAEIKIKTKHNTEVNLFSNVPVQKQKHKLYKFLFFDELQNQWKVNNDVISQFILENNLKHPGPHPTLVFYFNSNEKDLITLNSKLINHLYPELDDENIYVYALCDKLLSLLQYNINLSEGTPRVKPVFLLLHAPKNKLYLKNIKKAIFCVYYFLSMICDIQIVVLNKNYINYQIDLLRKINNIKRGYVKPYEDLQEFQETQSSSSEEEEENINDDNNYSNECFDNDFEDSSDGDEDNNDDEQNYKKNGNINNENDDDLILDNNYTNILPKESKLIILINDEKIKNEIKIEKENHFFKKIEEQINNEGLLKIHYINVNNALTYRDFLSSLCEFGYGAQFELNLISEKLYYIYKSDINDLYIHIKSQDYYQTSLKNFIFRKYNHEQKRIFNDEIDHFDYMVKLNNEIKKIYPSFDEKFGIECEELINELKEKLNQNNLETFQKQLNISSENSLNYLSEIINNQLIWSIEKKDLVKKNHVNFLKNEFLSINKIYCPSKNDCLRFLEMNHPILDKQIENDLKIIENIFNKHEEKVKLIKSQRLENLSQIIKKGTNYTIKETENVRELKVMAETGNLTDIIDQDF